ncbi:MAG: hypothetical protein CMJ34_02850 [Phycisphaerae bacterium]|nr:hypothetical protein [Phycisphaerae bacterium]
MALAIGAMTFSASAEELPGGSITLLTQDQAMSWQAGIDGAFDWTEDGYDFSGSDNGSGWNVQWDMMVAGNAGESIVANFTVMNTSTSAETFYLYLADPINGDYSGGSLVGGSIAGSFTDLNGNGVNVSAADQGAIYSAFVDGSPSDIFSGTTVGTLLQGAAGSASSFFTGTFSGESFGDFPTIPGGVGPTINTNFGILLGFELSAGDTAAFTASMAIATPTPGVLALFSVAGASRRRRRAI